MAVYAIRFFCLGLDIVHSDGAILSRDLSSKHKGNREAAKFGGRRTEKKMEICLDKPVRCLVAPEES